MGHSIFLMSPTLTVPPVSNNFFWRGHLFKKINSKRQWSVRSPKMFCNNLGIGKERRKKKNIRSLYNTAVFVLPCQGRRKKHETCSWKDGNQKNLGNEVQWQKKHRTMPQNKSNQALQIQVSRPLTDLPLTNLSITSVYLLCPIKAGCIFLSMKKLPKAYIIVYNHGSAMRGTKWS